VAALAMILGCSYEQVYHDMENQFDAKGLNFHKALAYLADHGLDVITKEWQSYGNIEDNNKRMIVPFADVHLVWTLLWADRKAKKTWCL
jgi:hypothetical protein